MGINAWPLDAVAGSPNYTGRMLRQLVGAVWTRSSRGNLIGGSGIIACPTQPVSAGGSTSYSVLPHVGVIDAESATNAGSYVYAVDTAVAGTTAAATASNYRRDLISIQISDPAESDGSSTPGVAVVYTQGTPNTVSGSAAVPATPARSLALCSILVPPAGSPTFDAWQCTVAVAAGGVLSPGQFGKVPAANTVAPGTLSIAGYGTSDVKLQVAEEAGVWVQLNQKGSTAYTVLISTASISGTTTFTQAYSTTKVPKVLPVITAAQPHAVRITAVTSTQFSWTVFRTAGTNAGAAEAGTFDWVAVL